jgi:hypothetical protein
VPQSFSGKTDRVRFIGLADEATVWEIASVTGGPASAAAAALLEAVRARPSQATYARDGGRPESVGGAG